jgi:Fe-S cluster biogenesis protein NfuA
MGATDCHFLGGRVDATDQQFRERMGRIEGLLREIEGFADPGARETAREVVQALMDLHGAGLGAMMELAHGAGEAGRSLIDAFGRDDLISSLLLLYGLHPVGLEARVRAALEKVGPVLRAHHGGVELLDTREGVVRLRLTGRCDGSPTSPAILKQAVEEAVFEAAPDAAAVEVEAPKGGVPPRFIPLPLVGG